MFLNQINEKIVVRSKVRSNTPWCNQAVIMVLSACRRPECWSGCTGSEVTSHRWILNVWLSLLVAARPSQSDSCGGGDLPGVLRLGAADHAHADREYTHIKTHTASRFPCSTDHLNVYMTLCLQLLYYAVSFIFVFFIPLVKHLRCRCLKCTL